MLHRAACEQSFLIHMPETPSLSGFSKEPASGLTHTLTNLSSSSATRHVAANYPASRGNPSLFFCCAKYP